MVESVASTPESLYIAIHTDGQTARGLLARLQRIGNMKTRIQMNKNSERPRDR